MTKSLLLVFLLGYIVSAKWENPIELFKSTGTLVWHQEYIDAATDTTHLAIVEKKGEKYSLSYLSLLKSKEISSAVLLTDNLPESGKTSVRISGQGNGKELIIVFTMERKAGVSDIYSCESKDGGVTWSKPSLARSNNLDDDNSRLIPEVLLLGSGRTFVFYKIKGKDLYSCSKSLNSIVWNHEMKINHNICTNIDSIKSIYSMVNNKSGYNILMSFGCKIEDSFRGIIAESTNNGLSWKFYFDEHYKLSAGEGLHFANAPVSDKLNYGILRENSGSDKFELATLFEYKSSNSWKEIISKPLQSVDISRVSVCSFDAVLYLVYFAAPKKIESKSAVLKFLKQEELYTISDIELPDLSENVVVTCHTDQIFAIGSNGDNKLMGQFYTKQYAFI